MGRELGDLGTTALPPQQAGSLDLTGPQAPLLQNKKTELDGV